MRFRHRDHRRFRQPYRSRGKATIFRTRKVLASGPVPYARGYVSIVTVASIVSRHAGLAGWLGDLSEMALPGGLPQRGRVFRYESWAADAETGTLTCRYSLDGREFTERVTLPPGPRWRTGAARAAARLVFLLAGVSYYKTAAPPVIDLGQTALTDAELTLLREFYLQGLGEFAYRNTLDLTSLRIEADRADPRATGQEKPAQPAAGGRPLVPFGGGIDSIVVTEHVRRISDAALFIMSRPADRFAAIEEPAAVTGLPVVRAEREIDPQLLRSAELGFLNGHVPVTGILSAIAVLAAVLTSRDAVVMSNEWSASIPTLQYQGRPVNHQYSKSAGFEAAFRQVLADAASRRRADADQRAADAGPTPGPRCRSTSPG